MNVMAMQLKNVLDSPTLLNVLQDEVQSYFSSVSLRREGFCILYYCMSLVFNNKYDFLVFIGDLKNGMNESHLDDVS